LVLVVAYGRGVALFRHTRGLAGVVLAEELALELVEGIEAQVAVEARAQRLQQGREGVARTGVVRRARGNVCARFRLGGLVDGLNTVHNALRFALSSPPVRTHSGRQAHKSRPGVARPGPTRATPLSHCEISVFYEIKGPAEALEKARGQKIPPLTRQLLP